MKPKAGEILSVFEMILEEYDEKMCVYVHVNTRKFLGAVLS